jgi:hypothetical protein
MGISTDQFTRHYPRLYHMAHETSWPPINRHGLLSTTALLDLFEIAGELRQSLENRHRSESVEIRHPVHGVATIRDQKPLSESALAKCLVGMTPKEWYRILNGYVFFWVTRERVDALLSARAYRDHKHTVICLDTAGLLARHEAIVRLSPINSGSTIYNPSPRGMDTFETMKSYPFDERRKARGVANAVAELAVEYAVPDISGLITGVEHRAAPSKGEL